MRKWGGVKRSACSGRGCSVIMANTVFSQIQGFKAQSLRHVATQITTPGGKKLTETRDASGTTTVTDEGDKTMGYCPDFTPDKNVGTVTKGLLVGSVDVAHDYTRLKELGVTHILNVGYGIPNAFPNDISYLTVEMFDDLSENILTHYPKCEEFIDEGRENGSVLVHCNAGRSRSVSIALAYVMHRERLAVDVALSRLRETRPAAEPNEGFMRQLRELQDSLGISSSTT